MLIKNYNDINKEKLNGKIIAFPTDTVFGVGAIINDNIGINKIYELKKRDAKKPLAILASSIEDILPYVEITNDKIVEIMNKYWPGALTIVFKKSSLVSSQITNGLDTIAFRIPNSEIAISILKQTGPLATTSVNYSGEAPINNYQEINNIFNDKIDYIVSENVISSNISSTIIDATSTDIKVIRSGQIKIDV